MIDFELPLMHNQIDRIVANKTFTRLSVVEALFQVAFLSCA